MEFRSRLVTAQVQAACRPFFCKNKIGNSWLTNAAFHGILIDVDGALAQLVAHNTGSVGVRSSNLLCSTKPKKSEHHPNWGWVRISFFIREIEDTQKAALQEKGFRNLWTVPRATDTKIRGCRGICESLPVRQTIKITKPICQNLEEWDSGFLYAACMKLR